MIYFYFKEEMISFNFFYAFILTNILNLENCKSKLSNKWASVPFKKTRISIAKI